MKNNIKTTAEIKPIVPVIAAKQLFHSSNESTNIYLSITIIFLKICFKCLFDYFLQEICPKGL